MPSGFISRPFTYYSPEGFSLAFRLYFPSIYLLLNRRLFPCLQALFPVHLLTTPPKAFSCLRDFTSCLFTYYSTEGFLLPSGFISRPFIYYSLEGFSLAFGIYFPSIYLLLPRRLFSCLRALFPVHLLTTPPKAFPLPSNFALFPFPLLNRKLSLALSFPICVSVYQKTQGSLLGFIGSRQRLSLPGRLHPSTFRAEELNFCVRDENRWFLFAIVTAIVLLRVSAVITFTA